MGWPQPSLTARASEAMERWNVTEPKLSHLWHPSRTVTSSLQWWEKKKRPSWPLSSSPIANSELMAIRLSSSGLGRSSSSFWLILGR